MTRIRRDSSTVGAQLLGAGGAVAGGKPGRPMAPKEAPPSYLKRFLQLMTMGLALTRPLGAGASACGFGMAGGPGTDCLPPGGLALRGRGNGLGSGARAGAGKLSLAKAAQFLAEASENSLHFSADIPDNVTGTPLYGCVLAGYRLNVTLGARARPHIFDTGSADIMLADQDCSGCNAKGGGYTPSVEAMLEHEGSVQYASGFMTGIVYTDGLSWGHEPKLTLRVLSTTVSDLEFSATGCSDARLTTEAFAGIFGVGPLAAASVSNDSVPAVWSRATGRPQVFATQLCDKNGLLFFGGYHHDHVTEEFTYASMTADRLALAGVETLIDAESTSDQGPAEMLVDTGSSLSYLPKDMHAGLWVRLQESLAEAFVNVKEEVPPKGDPPCWSAKPGITRQSLDQQLPPLELRLSQAGLGESYTNVTMRPTYSYLLPVTLNRQEKYCLTFVPASIAGFNILGSGWMREHTLLFEPDNLRIGFARQNQTFCDANAP